MRNPLSLLHRQRISQALKNRRNKKRRKEAGRAIADGAAMGGAGGLLVGKILNDRRKNRVTAEVDRRVAETTKRYAKRVSQLNRSLERVGAKVKMAKDVQADANRRKSTPNMDYVKGAREERSKRRELEKKLDSLMDKPGKDPKVAEKIKKTRRAIEWAKRNESDLNLDETTRSKTRTPKAASARAYAERVRNVQNVVKEKAATASKQGRMAVENVKLQGKQDIGAAIAKNRGTLLKAGLSGVGIGAGAGALAYGVDRWRRKRKERKARGGNNG